MAALVVDLGSGMFMLGIAGWIHSRCVPFVRRQARDAWHRGFRIPGSGHARR